MVTRMTRKELRRLARDLRTLGRSIRSFDMAAHLAATAKPALKAGDGRSTICDNCGEPTDTTKPRPHGSSECLPCYRATLAHGHLHTDHDASVADCPLCQQERKEDRLIGSKDGR